jgi:plasmid stabilization system protein ParE
VPIAVVILPRAVEQISLAAAWWRQHRPEAPTMLEDELGRALARLADTPNAGAPVRSRAGLRDVRRLLLRRTGYAIFYRVRERAGRVDVAAFWYGGRGSTPPLR